jgi:hypothetical protein
MSGIPDGIVLKRDRDLEGRRHEIWLRRGLFALMPTLCLLALLNVFGQRPTTSSATSAAASLEVEAPGSVRSGLLYGARFRVTATRPLANATLLLDPGWLEAMTVNTIEPSPVDEGSVDGKLKLELGPIDAGDTFVLFVDFQVNPTNVGRRDQDVQLLDGDEPLLEIDRSITIFP